MGQMEAVEESGSECGVESRWLGFESYPYTYYLTSLSNGDNLIGF